MAERITNAQFRSRANWLTNRAREVGAIAEDEWFGTAVAWSMSYVCVYDVDGRMVRSFNNSLGTKRQMFDYMGAMADAMEMVAR